MRQMIKNKDYFSLPIIITPYMKSLLLLALSTTFFLSSCDFIDGRRVDGNGNMKTEDRSVSEFRGVESSGSFDVYVSTGPQSVKIEADENLLPLIETNVEGDQLKINSKRGFNLESHNGIKIFVTAPTFTKIHSYGSGNIISQSKISGTSPLDLGVTGSADIKVEVEVPEVSADITGSGNIFIKGETKKFTAQVSGSGSVKGFDLKSEETKMEIAGSGDADVFASVKLTVQVSGSGDIRYKGNPSIEQQVSGSGSVKKVD